MLGRRIDRQTWSAIDSAAKHPPIPYAGLVIYKIQF